MRIGFASFPGMALHGLLVAALAMTPSLAPAGTAAASDVDRYVARAMRAWDQPGLALAVIDEDQVVLARGYGVLDKANGGRVDENSVFGIGSCTKSFAAATIGKLVEQHRLRWDDRVRTHLPWFALYDPWISDHVTIRDLLSMRTGTASSAATFRVVASNRADLVRRMRHLPPVAPFRDRFVYTTDNYTVAGEIVAAVEGRPWEAVASRMFWTPLGMRRTNADHRVARTLPNSATPHITIDGKLRAIEWIYEDHIAVPAGGMNSSAHDLARWVRSNLAGGVHEGQRLLERATLAEMQQPHSPDRDMVDGREFSQMVGAGPDGVEFESYALGWATHSYRGHRVVWHNGSIDGFRCMIAMLPERGFGMVALLNSDQGDLGRALAQWLIDRELGAPAVDWSQRFLAEVRQRDAKAAEAEARLQDARKPDVRPSWPLEALAGRFADAGAYGEVTLIPTDGGLTMTAGPVAYDFRHWSGNVFEAYLRWPYPYPREFFVTFNADESGAVSGFRTSTGFSFARLE